MPEAYVYALIGGSLIGAAALLLFALNGRILGVSGILGGVLTLKSKDLAWRWVFLLGLILGALIIEPLSFSVMALEVDRSMGLVALGGLAVGFGTNMSNGCTSGHGVCGVSRLSKRSMVATVTFILFGIFTVALINLLSGGLM